MGEVTRKEETSLHGGMDKPHQRLLDLILYKTYADLKFEAKRTYIGFAWWIIEPIVFMLIFVVVFGIAFGRGTEDYVPFLLIGLTAWHWTQSNVVQSCTAISNNQGLIQQVYVPKFVFPTVLLLSTTAKFLVVFVILVLYLLSDGFRPSWHWLHSGVVLANMFLLTAGLTYTVAAISPFVPDIRILIDNLYRGIFFLSGIFYDIQTLPESVQSWLQYNPYAVLISDLRGSLMYQLTPGLASQAVIAATGVVLLVFGLYLIRRNELRYAKTLL